MRLIYPCLILLALVAACGVPDGSGGPEPSGQPQFESVPAFETGGHTSRITGFAFTPDGERLISVSEDRSGRTWNVATGALQHVWRGETFGAQGELVAAALSPAGEFLAVGGVLAPTRLLDPETGEARATLGGHHTTIDWVAALAFSPDGTRLAGAPNFMMEQAVRVWELDAVGAAAGPPVVLEHDAQVADIAWSPDGERLASVAADGALRIWDLAAGEPVQVTEADDTELLSVAWSPDGSTVATGSADGTVRLWNPATGAERGALPAGDGPVADLAFNPDGSRLAAAGGDEVTGSGTVCLWALPEGRLALEFTAHDAPATAVAFSPDGRTVASAGGYAREIYLWDAATGEVRHRLAGVGRDVVSLGWSADGTRLAWGFEPEFRDVNDRGPLQHTFNLAELEPGPEARPGEQWQRAVTRLGERELVLGEDGRTVILREGDREVATFPGPRGRELLFGRVLCYTLAPDGQAVVGFEHGISNYDPDGDEVLDHGGYPGPGILAVAVSIDGQLLATARRNHRISVVAAPLGPFTTTLMMFLVTPREDWGAITSYYAASPGAERLFGWQVNQGEGRPARFYPVYQFRRLFERPDVLREVIRERSNQAIIRELFEARWRPRDLSEFLPPDVEIVSPDPGEVAVEQVTVRARIMDPNSRPVAEATLQVNDGEPQPLARDGEEWTATAALRPGENVLRVLAVNDAGAESLPAEVEVVSRPR